MTPAGSSKRSPQGLAVNLPQTGQATLTLFHNQPVGKQGKSFEHHVVTRGSAWSTVLHHTARYGRGRNSSPPVGTKIESVLIVIKTVFMIFTPWQKADRLGVGSSALSSSTSLVVALEIITTNCWEVVYAR